MPAMRALRRTPVFTVVAVASLALGIGANTAIYTLIDTLIQMGSDLPPDALMTIVTVALKYECPELAGKLGG